MANALIPGPGPRCMQKRENVTGLAAFYRSVRPVRRRLTAGKTGKTSHDRMRDRNSEPPPAGVIVDFHQDSVDPRMQMDRRLVAVRGVSPSDLIAMHQLAVHPHRNPIVAPAAQHRVPRMDGFDLGISIPHTPLARR